MTTAKIAIKGNGFGSVVIDSHDLSNAIRSLRFVSEAGNRPELELELWCDELTTLESDDVILTLYAPSREALIALGWTPPREAS